MPESNIEQVLSWRKKARLYDSTKPLADTLGTENACLRTIIKRLEQKVAEQDRQLRLLQMPKDNVIVLMQENESQRRQIADLTRELDELKAKYNKDVHGEPND